MVILPGRISPIPMSYGTKERYSFSRKSYSILPLTLYDFHRHFSLWKRFLYNTMSRKLYVVFIEIEQNVERV